MEQGSQEWLDLRRTKIGASDAAAIMGRSPYKTAFDVWEEKVLGKKLPVTNAMREGLERESEARAAFESLMNVAVIPTVIVEEYQMASLDGITLERDMIVEIKCPKGPGLFELAKNGNLPDEYWIQIQHQLYFSEAEMAYYYCYFNGNGIALKVFPDGDFIKEMLISQEKFYQYMVTQEPPPLTDRDYTVLEDKKFIDLLNEYQEINDELHVKKQAQEHVRDQLIELAKGKNTKSSNGRLTRSVCKGQVDYKLVPELIGVNLEQYRKPPCEKWRITVINKDGA